MGKKSRKQAWRGRMAFVAPRTVIETVTGQRIEFVTGPAELTRQGAVEVREAIRVTISRPDGSRLRRRQVDFTAEKTAELFALFGWPTDFDEVDMATVDGSNQCRLSVVVHDVTPRQIEQVRQACPMGFKAELLSAGRAVVGKVTTDSIMPQGRRRDYSAGRGEGSAEPHIDGMQTLAELDHTDARRSRTSQRKNEQGLYERLPLTGHRHDDRHSEST